MQKMLILGANGLVGKALIDEFKNDFDLYGTYASSVPSLPVDKQYKLDIHQIDNLKEMLRTLKPVIVISCLRGEFDQQLRFHEALAMELTNTSSRMYYFSTTNVFDGDFSKPHMETDLPIAESDYEKFKIACEDMLKEMLDERVMIIRIPAVWGKNSPRWSLIKESITNNKEIEVYSNLVCNHLSDVGLTKQMRFMIEKELKGIFHLGSLDSMTEGQFYERIFSRLKCEKSLLHNRLYQDNRASFYFQLRSNRDDLPGSLHSTNEEIISYLLDK